MLRIVGIAGHHAVAVGDQRALALGVVGDALDIERVVEEDLLEPAGIVVDRAQLPPLAFHVLRELHALDAVQGIVARGGLIGRRSPVARLRGRRGSAAAAGSQSTWKGVTLPAIGRRLVEDGEDRRIGDDAAGFVEHIALEVDRRHRGEPGFVVMTMELAQKIARSRIASRSGCGWSGRPRRRIPSVAAG